MADREYLEPDNKQLANFLAVYGKSIFGDDLDFNPLILEGILNGSPRHREVALRHHRAFQDEIFEMTKKMAAGELKCEFIRPNGKRCVNYNQPGTMYCGLHQDQGD